MLKFLILSLISVAWPSVASANPLEIFLQCLHNSENSDSVSKFIHTPIHSSYSSVLQFAARNGRFRKSDTPKPLVVVTPLNVAHIQSAVICSRKYGLQIRVRSGGHDYEGLSYVSVLPFIVVDLIHIRTVTVDVANRTAWVEGGATLGEVYYKIAEKSRTLAFPAGVCSTVGVGGHFSGGGHGMMLRKYGLAADKTIDAKLIDVEGRILDRESMGEDLFWAIRGGGGNTFGVIIAWKIELVPVPPVVTVFNVQRSLEQNDTGLVHRWQYAIGKFHEDLFSRIFLWGNNASAQEAGKKGKTTVLAAFHSLFLGGSDRLLEMMQETFPELGLVKEDCIEMSWVESTIYFAPVVWNSSLEALLDRTRPATRFFKAKTDYVTQPMPETALEGIVEKLNQLDANAIGELQFTAYGGKMDEISESSIPFPHRAGNLYQIHYMVFWSEESSNEASQKYYIDWIRELYSYMTPYVTKSPRAAYINYRDLDLGVNNVGETSYEEASIWGTKYFKNNFERLVRVKTAVDPTNFFSNEQSIPPHLSHLANNLA